MSLIGIWIGTWIFELQNSGCAGSPKLQGGVEVGLCGRLVGLL